MAEGPHPSALCLPAGQGCAGLIARLLLLALGFGWVASAADAGLRAWPPSPGDRHRRPGALERQRRVEIPETQSRLQCHGPKPWRGLVLANL
jgi:hypothetical protein